MILIDVNVLVYAFRTDAIDHLRYRAWLQNRLEAPEAFGLADLALSGFIRITTHPAILAPPNQLEEALSFVESLKTAWNCVTVTPGARHWGLFLDLCRTAGARGNLIPDAYFAALAIESGCEWITTDRHCARFPHLRWSHPLKA